MSAAFEAPAGSSAASFGSDNLRAEVNPAIPLIDVRPKGRVSGAEMLC
jgi:hypothetical protein